MGSTTLLLLHLSFTSPPSLSLLNHHIKFPHTSSVASHWSLSNSPSASSTARVRINLEDELYTDGDDGFDDFGFPGTAKQRTWWSNDDYDDDGWFNDDEDNEFWIFKVIRAFGWMIPAIGISLLLGTGPNAFFMALAVPLGQTALFLVMDKVWGSASSRSKPRPGTRTRTRTRAKKKPFVRPAEKKGEGKEEKKTSEGKGTYQSWMAADGGSYKKSGKRVHKFGGWDELDDVDKVPGATPRRKEDDVLPKQQVKSKLSRTRRIGDTPLLLRLLIAVFPFLGSWTRFLF